MFSLLGGTFLPYDHGLDFKISLQRVQLVLVFTYTVYVFVCVVTAVLYVPSSSTHSRLYF